MEVAIYGEPGAYVGLSGIDKSFYSMQAGNELSYAQVITRMAHFGEETNGTFLHSWHSHEGDPDENVYFPSSTFGIDANRTFEYAGLVVFSDVILPRRPGFCNATLGFLECLSGLCFHIQTRCDGRMDCPDGTDESGCPSFNATELSIFRKQRFNRIQRQYENVWMWHDINIGPHGRYIFDIPVPKRPVHWMVSAFSMGPVLGFGMVQKAIEVGFFKKNISILAKSINYFPVCRRSAFLHQRGNAHGEQTRRASWYQSHCFQLHEI